MSTKHRLRELREEAGLSQQSVAKQISISDSAYQNYEYGIRDIPSNVLQALAVLYDVSVDYILGLADFRNITFRPRSEPGDFVEVPLYGSIAAGIPIEMIETDGTFPLPTQKHKQYPQAFLLKIEGESMNKILPNGSYALIDPCKDVDQDGQPYAICVNGNNATVKRVRKLNNGFELIPDSTDPTFCTQTYNYNESDTETITVIGRVVYYILPFDWGF